MKVYVGTDVEGVAGVVTFTAQAYPDGKYYEAAKKLLTAEVNAAVEGMLEAGVDDILVMDGHGCGGVSFEDLHPEAKLLHGRPLATREVRNEVVKGYDVSIMIGQHAMAGGATANLNHTQSSQSIDSYTLNGKPVGEIAQFALYQGGLGLPMIFLSGDEAACREVEELIPGVTAVSVKQGLGRNSAVSLSAAKARERIREGARLAIERQQQGPLPPLVWEGPFVLEKRFFHTDVADAAAAHPCAERVDSQTVRYRCDDILDIVYI